MASIVTLSQLTAFAKVAGTLNYSRAADELGYSEAAVYQQVRKLEQSLRVKLFYVVDRKVQLTSAGLSLAPMASRIVREAEEFELSALSRLPTENTVAVAAGSVTSSFLMEHVVKDMQHHLPDIPLQIHVTPNNTVLQLLLERRVQLGVITRVELPMNPIPLTAVDSSTLTVTPWIHDEWILVCQAGMFSSPDIDLFYSASYGLTKPILNNLVARLPVEITPAFFPLPTIDPVKSAAIGGLGFSLLPRMSVMRELNSGILRQVIPESVGRHLSIVSLHDATPQICSVREYLLRLNEVRLNPK